MKQYKVGIIGCGNIFPIHGQSLVNTPGVALELEYVPVAIEMVKRYAGKYGI